MLISRGCPWASMKRGGCKFGASKIGAVLCPKRGGGCSFAVGTQAQRVSAPPPPGGAFRCVDRIITNRKILLGYYLTVILGL